MSLLRKWPFRSHRSAAPAATGATGAAGRAAVAAAAGMAVEALESRRLLAAVAVDLDDVHQTIEGIGGTYAKAAFKTTSQDAIGRYTLEHLDPKFVRVAIPLSNWEPLNDDADANAFTWSGFKTGSGKLQSLFNMIKGMKADGRTVIASVFDVPDWMVSNPTKSNQRLIAAGMHGELIESMAAFVKHAADQYGATIDFLSFNETNGGYDVKLAADEHAGLIELGGQRLAALGFNPKWMVGETYQVRNSVPYMKAILDDPRAQPYLGPVAFHSWWSEGIPREEWQMLRDLADDYGKELWNTEMNYYALAPKNTPEVFPTWGNARRLAAITLKTLAWANADVAMYWQYQDDFPLMSADTTVLYPSYHVVKTLWESYRPGTQVVTAASDTSTVITLAGKHVADDTFSMTVLNNSVDVDQTVTLTGLPDNPLTLVRQSEGNNYEVVGTVTPVDGVLTLTMPRATLATLTGQLSEPEPPAQQPYKGVPFAVGPAAPAVIQAEDFDLGGLDVAYHDLTPGNDGNVYRTDVDVDLRATADAGGGYRLASPRAGEWLEYTIDVAEAGTYTLAAHVGNYGAGASFHVEVDGVDVTGSLAVPNTGGYDKFATVTKTGIQLAAGTHVLRLSLDANATTGGKYAGTVNWLRLTAVTETPDPQQPFTGVPVAIGSAPVTVQAEDYDLGGEGVAYHDTTSGNAGNVYRPAEGVDLRATADAGGGYRTASPKAGEWLEYTVDVAAAGLYDLAFRVATSGTGGRFHAEVDGQDVTGSLAVPNTGGYDTFATVTKAGVQLAAGRHVLRVALDADATSGWAPGLNWFRVTPAAQTQENPTLPEGWTGADVGTVGKAGSSYASDGVFTVTGAGDGIGGRRDEAHLAYRTLAGNGQIVARLTGFDAASPADALAGLQIRLSTNSQQKAASLLLTKGGQLKTVLRSGFGTSATTRSVTGGGVPQWMKLIRAGDTITLHASADGTTWSQVGHLMTSLYDNVLVGLTVSSGTSTALATATFDNVSVTPA